MQSFLSKSVLTKRRCTTRESCQPSSLPSVLSTRYQTHQSDTCDTSPSKCKSLSVSSQIIAVSDSIADRVNFHRRLLYHLHLKQSNLKLALEHVVKEERSRVKQTRNLPLSKLDYMKHLGKPNKLKLRELRSESIELQSEFCCMEKRRKDHILQKIKEKRDAACDKRKTDLARTHDRYILA